MATAMQRRCPKEVRIGLLGCGFMGKCHTNAYKKIPYIYCRGENQTSPGGALRREGPARRAGGRAIRLRGVLHRLAGTGRRPADRRVRQLRPGPRASRAVHCRLEARQARDLRETDGGFGGSCPANARRGRGGVRQGDVHLQLSLHARRAAGQRPDHRRPDRQDLPHPHPLLADVGPRSVLAAREGLGFRLAALGRFAGDRQPRHRSVPFSHRRDCQRLGLGAGFQQRAGRAERRLPGRGHLGRRHRGAAGFRKWRHRRAGILGGGHGPQELPRLGDQRLPRLAALGPGASQQPVRLLEQPRQRLADGLYRNLGDRAQSSLRGSMVAVRGTTWAGNMARSSRSSISSMRLPTANP